MGKRKHRSMYICPLCEIASFVLQREIGGRLWLLLLSFYGLYYGAYLYLVYKILQSLPGMLAWRWLRGFAFGPKTTLTVSTGRFASACRAAVLTCSTADGSANQLLQTAPAMPPQPTFDAGCLARRCHASP